MHGLPPDMTVAAILRVTRRRRRHRVASSSRRVAPPWPEVGSNRLSLRSWSVQRARGRPGRRLQSLPSERPDARPAWKSRALCAGVPWVSRAMWPNTDKRRLLMKSITGGKPVRADILHSWHAQTSVCARFGVGTSCGMPPTFFRHTKVMSKFLQHIAKRTSQGYHFTSLPTSKLRTKSSHFKPSLNYHCFPKSLKEQLTPVKRIWKSAGSSSIIWMTTTVDSTWRRPAARCSPTISALSSLRMTWSRLRVPGRGEVQACLTHVITLSWRFTLISHAANFNDPFFSISVFVYACTLFAECLDLVTCSDRRSWHFDLKITVGFFVVFSPTRKHWTNSA